MTPAELKQAREERGLTQKEFAERLGVQPNTYARWERGELAVAHSQMLRRAIRTIRKRSAS